MDKRDQGNGRNNSNASNAGRNAQASGSRDPRRSSATYKGGAKSGQGDSGSTSGWAFSKGSTSGQSSNGSHRQGSGNSQSRSQSSSRHVSEQDRPVKRSRNKGQNSTHHDAQNSALGIKHYADHATILSVQNDRVKQWAALLDKKQRDRSGMFIVEGVHLVLEALRHAEVACVVYDVERGVPSELEFAAEQSKDASSEFGSGQQSEQWTGLGDDSELDNATDNSPTTGLHRLNKQVEWINASPAVMAKCTDTDTAPPVFAVVYKFAYSAEGLYADKQALVVALDGLRDPGNVGTIIRSADAVGASAVVLGKGCVDLYNPKTVRSTMGSLFHLPIIEADLQTVLPAAQAEGAAIIGTSLQATSSCYDLNWTEPSWIVLGNESTGLTEAVESHVDTSVIIPMRGNAESLNAAMAATVLLYEALRQRLV